MKYDLVLFDLDGTLLDTLEDLADAVNHALSAAGFPTRSLEEVRRFIGNGVGKLIERSVPQDVPAETRSHILADFRARYSQHVNDKTRPYPGVDALLTALGKAGVATAVNSNKMDSAVQALCEAHFPGRLSAALGERAEIPRKPSPEGALQLMARLKASPARTLYVGDGVTDLQTAANAGIDAAWVSWGYRRREELGALPVRRRFDDADALLRFILGQ